MVRYDASRKHERARFAGNWTAPVTAREILRESYGGEYSMLKTLARALVAVAFGLAVLKQALPDAKIVALPATAAASR